MENEFSSDELEGFEVEMDLSLAPSFELSI